MSGNWIFAFDGRNRSGCETLNFLWNDGPVYIMDNHRAAMWCWLQKMDNDGGYGLAHIDAHYDCDDSDIEELFSCIGDVKQQSLKDHLSIVRPWCENSPIVFYGNFLAIFLKKYGDEIKESFFCTHGYGEEPKHARKYDYDIFSMNRYFKLFIEQNDKIILDIDLDFFFYENEQGSDYIFSDTYFDELMTSIKKARQEGKIKAMTIALSPECCGGWENAENACTKICESLGINFSLPK